LADKYGRKKVFLVGVVLFVAASVACGLAGSVEWPAAARVLQGVGAALLTPAPLSLVRALAAFPTNKRAVASSLNCAFKPASIAGRRYPPSRPAMMIG
jgi:MFS family permease